MPTWPALKLFCTNFRVKLPPTLMAMSPEWLVTFWAVLPRVRRTVPLTTTSTQAVAV